MKETSCTSLCRYSAQTPRVNASPFAKRVANGRGRRKETRASLTFVLQATSSKHPMMGLFKSGSSSPVIRSTRAKTKAHFCESTSAIQDLNSFRTGSQSRLWSASIKDKWPFHRKWLRRIVFHGISRLGSGNARLLPLRVAPYPARMRLVAPADNIIWLLIHRHLVFALERSWEFLQWIH
jgi:hypothetical protein